MTRKKHTKLDPNTQDGKILLDIVNAVYNDEPLSGPDGVIPKLLKKAMDSALDGEMDGYLAENNIEEPNRRNGTSSKTVKSKHGSFELDTPRDRNSSFEPNLVKKRQTELNSEIEEKILALYGMAASYEDISGHIADLYGIEVSNATISSVTDKLLPQVNEWRQRALEEVYPIIFLDAMFFKAREEGAVKTKVMYNILGINTSGHKEILGFYICDSEGASFWLGVLNDLKARGVRDIFIACIDGLKGFPEALNTAFPQTEVQLCIVHQIRSSVKLVASKDQKKFIADLKTIYQAPNLEAAEANLQKVLETWKKYPAALRGWVDNWDNITNYLKFSPMVRKLIYTTNPIEGFHRQVRKFTKTKGSFTSENALMKLTFAAIMKITQKWNQPISNWALTISELDIHFPKRLPLWGCSLDTVY
jgi:transposase-like protein